VVDGVPQLIMISAAVGGDCLPSSVSYCVLVSGPEGWTLVTAEYIRPIEDFHHCLVLFSSTVRNSHDSDLWRCGHVDAVQQIRQSSCEDRGFISNLISSTSQNVSSFSTSLNKV
jgi:hypothetical protein